MFPSNRPKKRSRSNISSMRAAIFFWRMPSLSLLEASRSGCAFPLFRFCAFNFQNCIETDNV